MILSIKETINYIDILQERRLENEKLENFICALDFSLHLGLL